MRREYSHTAQHQIAVYSMRQGSSNAAQPQDGQQHSTAQTAAAAAAEAAAAAAHKLLH